MKKILTILLMLSSINLMAQNKPNIIYIMADDMGNSDMSRNGTKYDTPTLDSLANEGAYFDRFYSYPGCTPTRAALMTGRYPLRMGLWQVVIGRYDNYCLPASENRYMLPRLMKEAGYQTALIGKWHLGHMYPECLPHTKGFDYYFGTSYGLINYYDWDFEGADDVRENGIYQAPDGTYFTDKIAEKCEDYLDNWSNCSSSPFFMFVPMLAPHVAPNGVGCDRLDIPADSLVNAPANLTVCQKRYWVMMRQMDYAISRIVNKVRDLGIENNTIIIFTSDNGGDVDYAGDNAPYKGEKGDLTEGGINVPAIWYHKGTVSPRVISTPVQVEDFHPTLLKIAGRDISDIEANLDGEDIYPLVQGGSIPQRMFLKQYQPTNNATTKTYAVIDGDYKLCNLCYSGTALYNIATNPAESIDYSGSDPSRVAAMQNFANSFNGVTISRSNNNATSPPSGWNPINIWADPRTFYDPDYYYYRNPKD
jgi:arylsulfatase A-like enzyme